MSSIATAAASRRTHRRRLVAGRAADGQLDQRLRSHQSGIPVTYGSVGSGAGIAQITARTVDFGASDAPLTPEQAAACNGCVQIPWALTATGLGFNILDGVKKLNLSGLDHRRHLLRQDHQVERPEDQDTQPGREDSGD